MKQMQQINGMSQNEMAHHVPLSSIPQLQEKAPRAESLIDKCLKGLIKERMSGRLINNERRGKFMEQRKMSMIYTGEKLIQEDRRQTLKKYLFGEENKRYDTSLDKKFKEDQYIGRHVSRRSSILSKKQLIQQRRKNINGFSMNLTKMNSYKQKPYFDQTINENELQKKFDKKNYSGNALSFISAIEDQNPEQDSGMNDKKSQQSLFHLPKINRKTVNIRNISVEKNQNSLSVLKNTIKIGPEETIHMELWNLLSDKQILLQKLSKKRKSSMTISDLNSSILNQNSNKKQSKGSMFKPKIPNSSRQLIMAYIDSLPNSLKSLMRRFLYFFDIKLPNEVSAIYYSQMLQKALKINKRGWTALGFRYWDHNKDGIINSQDIFAKFREINDIGDSEDEIQKTKKISQPLRKKVEKKGQHKKQQIQETEEKQNNTYELKKVPNLPSKRKTTQFPQSEAGSESGPLSIMNEKDQKQNLKQIVKKLQNVRQANILIQKTLSRLNDRVKQESLGQSDEQKQETNIEIKYLQQVILSNPATKYIDIQPLLSAGKNNSGSAAKEQHKRQLFPEELKVKCSSSYRQCFVATQHNQETRMTREKIESYKSELKEMKKKRIEAENQKIRQNLKTQKFISYEEYVDEGFGDKIRRIVLSVLGAKQI